MRYLQYTTDGSNTLQDVQNPAEKCEIDYKPQIVSNSQIVIILLNHRQ